MALELEFVCHSCQTRFTAVAGQGLQWVSCPVCHVRAAVQDHVAAREIVDPIAVPGTPIAPAAALGDEEDAFADQRAKKPRERNWVLIGGIAFLGLWALITAIMLLLGALATRKKVVVAPTPPPVTTPVPPAHKPLFDVDNPSSQPSDSNNYISNNPPPPRPSPATKPQQPPHAELRVVPRQVGLTDAEVQKAIRRGIDFLLSNVKGDQLDPANYGYPVRHEGHNALVVYTLLHCSESIHDERIGINGELMRGMLAKMKSHALAPVEVPNVGAPVTYARSLRASALAIYDRPEDREALRGDVAWLVSAAYQGAYTYDDYYTRPGSPGTQQPPSPHFFDHSNSQYGVLGVWNGAESGALVPARYWIDVEKHWVAQQIDNGMWGYHEGDAGTTSMTCAGIMALSITRDYLEMAGETDNPDRPAAGAALDKALKWLETGDNAVKFNGGNGGGVSGYSLYGMERATLASGMMYPGNHDFYREMAQRIIPTQHPNGSFGNVDSGPDAIVETSFYLLFLARGRNAVMVSKLRYDGAWNNHPRDCADLARWSSYAMERPVNWQIVKLSQPWTTWMDCPILYIAGSEAPALTEAQVTKLREYANNGGLIFTHADYGSQEFNAFAEDLARRLWPAYEMRTLPTDHDLYTIQFPIQPPPKLRFVSNGSRLLLIHSPEDITGKWRIRGNGLVRGAKASRATAVAVGATTTPTLTTPAPTTPAPTAPTPTPTPTPTTPAPTTPTPAPGTGTSIVSAPGAPGAPGVPSASGTAVTPMAAPTVALSSLSAFQFGVNLFSYVSGRNEPRTRLENPYIAAPTTGGYASARAVPIALLHYAGNPDPEPAAWQRFARYFWYETGWRLTPVTTPIASLKYAPDPLGWRPAGRLSPDDQDASATTTPSDQMPTGFRLAHLTGTTSDVPSNDDAAALRAFLDAGGTLIVDACGGSRRFVDVFYNRWLPSILAAPSSASAPSSAGLTPLAPDDAILTGELGDLRSAAADLTKPMLRPYTLQVIKPTITRPLELRVGKGRIIFSELDVTTGLLGTNIWGVNGYAPAYAQGLMKNVILWSEGQRGL